MSAEDKAQHHGHRHDHGLLKYIPRENRGALGRLGFTAALLLCPADDILTAVASATLSTDHNHEAVAVIPPAVGVITTSENRRSKGRSPKLRPQGSIFQSRPITNQQPRFDSYVKGDPRNSFPNGLHRSRGGWVGVLR